MSHNNLIFATKTAQQLISGCGMGTRGDQRTILEPFLGFLANIRLLIRLSGA